MGASVSDTSMGAVKKLLVAEKNFVKSNDSYIDDGKDQRRHNDLAQKLNPTVLSNPKDLRLIKICKKKKKAVLQCYQAASELSFVSMKWDIFD